jgi:enoyl-CoA hydratase/carnithine racemase
MNDATDAVLLETRDKVFWIIINRPDRGNAINQAVTAGISAGIKSAMASPDIRAIVLTGAGDRVFCAGGDMKPTADGAPFAGDPANPGNMVTDMFADFEACSLPIVARLNGHALAGGLGLLCACDLAIAKSSARIGTPETGVGLFPMMILPYMQRIIPRRLLMEMCITGEPWTAEQALEAHLVNYVAPDDELDSKLDWLLSRITNRSPTAIRIGKKAVHAMQDMSLNEGFEYAQIMLPAMAQTEDAKEGFAAYNEKRDPKWTNR